MEIQSKFGEAIRKARRAADLTLGTLADKIGISPGYLSDIEQGRKAPPSGDAVARFAEALVMDLNLLSQLAAESRGAFKLLVEQMMTPKHLEVGAALERHWTSLDDAQLSQILNALLQRKDTTE